MFSKQIHTRIPFYFIVVVVPTQLCKIIHFSVHFARFINTYFFAKTTHRQVNSTYIERSGFSQSTRIQINRFSMTNISVCVRVRILLCGIISKRLIVSLLEQKKS